MQILFISLALLLTGFLTIIWNRNNIIKIFIGAELCLFAASWNFIFAFVQLGLIDGLVFILIYFSHCGSGGGSGFRFGSVGLPEIWYHSIECH